jgi:hypothetical protein
MHKSFKQLIKMRVSKRSRDVSHHPIILIEQHEPRHRGGPLLQDRGQDISVQDVLLLQLTKEEARAAHHRVLREDQWQTNISEVTYRIHMLHALTRLGLQD